MHSTEVLVCDCVTVKQTVITKTMKRFFISNGLGSFGLNGLAWKVIRKGLTVP